ncbi:MAG: DMT family transporter [Candidatus Binatia bacterium]
MSAILSSLLTSLCFASASLFAQKGLHLLNSPWGVWVTLVANCFLLLAIHLLLHPDAPILIPGNLLFVLIGLFVPGITRLLTFRGIQRMGSSVTATIVNSTPMFSTLLAIVFLHEHPSPLVFAGIGSIVGGVMTLSWGREKKIWRRTELFYPFAAAFLFASKDVLARWGLGVTGQPALAALIAVVTATLEVFLILRYVQAERFVLPPLRVSLWFVISGIFTGGAFFFMFFALHMEEVAIVSPIVSSHSVFVLLLSPLIARQIERVTLRKGIGAVGVVAGVFLISLGRN